MSVERHEVFVRSIVGRSLVRWFVGSFVRSFRLFVRLFVFVCSFVRFFVVGGCVGGGGSFIRLIVSVGDRSCFRWVGWFGG